MGVFIFDAREIIPPQIGVIHSAAQEPLVGVVRLPRDEVKYLIVFYDRQYRHISSSGVETEKVPIRFDLRRVNQFLQDASGIFFEPPCGEPLVIEYVEWD